MNADEHKKRPSALARLTSGVIRWALTRRLVRAALLYSEHRGPMLADSITYRALFSVFAGLLLGFSVASLWLSGNEAAWNSILDAIDATIPGLVGPDGLVDPSTIVAPVAFSLTGIASLVALIGAALSAIGSLRIALRTLADTTHEDVFWLWVILRNIALALGIALSFLIAALLTFSGSLGVTWIADVLGIPADSATATWGVRIVSIAVTFLLDMALIAAVFRMLSGVRASARSLWPGAALGAIGLIVLQELSGLFVGGATSNPLLASFAALLALLIWFNLSAQVLLVASAYILTAVEEEHDRVEARFGAQTFAQRRVRRAERAVQVATDSLRAAQQAEREERMPDEKQQDA